MAKSQQPETGSLPKTTVYRTTDRPRVVEHARDRWAERAADHDQTVDDAWREATPVHYGVHNSLYLRYHVESDTLLLAERTHTGAQAVTVLKTVLSREWEEDHPGVRRAVDAIRRQEGRQ